MPACMLEPGAPVNWKLLGLWAQPALLRARTAKRAKAQAGATADDAQLAGPNP